MTTTPITREFAYDVVRAFLALKYFPSDPEARTAIMALVMSMCATEQEATWLRERVYAEWDEWRGPHELRALFCKRFRPKDGIEASPHGGSGRDQPLIEADGAGQPTRAPQMRFEVVVRRDVDGNLIEGVKLLGIAGPERLELPAAKNAESVDAAECKALVAHVGGKIQTKIKEMEDALLPAPSYPPNKNCKVCFGTGWRLDGQLRCACTFEPAVKPIAIPPTRRLEAEFRASWLALQSHIEMGLPAGENEADRELKAAMTPRKSEQELEAEVAKLEAAHPHLRDPKRGGGKYRETEKGTEVYLVQ